MARDTKLGPEAITRDIPNVGEEALTQSRRSRASCAYRRRGSPGDILVGKVTPKGETPMTPEEKLLRAIFGEKAARCARHLTSKVPPGVTGTIVEVRRSSQRRGVDKDERAMRDRALEIERLAKDRDDERRIILRQRNVYVPPSCSRCLMARSTESVTPAARRRG